MIWTENHNKAEEQLVIQSVKHQKNRDMSQWNGLTGVYWRCDCWLTVRCVELHSLFTFSQMLLNWPQTMTSNILSKQLKTFWRQRNRNIHQQPLQLPDLNPAGCAFQAVTAKLEAERSTNRQQRRKLRVWRCPWAPSFSQSPTEVLKLMVIFTVSPNMFEHLKIYFRPKRAGIGSSRPPWPWIGLS